MLNGYVYTVNESKPLAQSIAIKDGRILYVGSDKGAKEFLGKDTKVVNLKNKWSCQGCRMSIFIQYLEESCQLLVI